MSKTKNNIFYFNTKLPYNLYYLTNERLLACNEKTKEYRSYFYKNWTTLKAISKNNQLEFSTGFKPQALYNVEDPEALQQLILEQIAKKQ